MKKPELTRAEKFKLRNLRKAKVAERGRAAPASFADGEAAPVRVLSSPITIAGASLEHSLPVYIPDPIAEDRDGRRTRRAIVKRFQAACGVAGLAAHAHLVAAHRGEGNRNDQPTAVVEQHAPLTYKYLAQFGNEELQSRQLVLEDFDMLACAVFGCPPADFPVNAPRLAGIHLDALTSLSKGLYRASWILQEADAAAGLSRDDGAWKRLDRAFKAGADDGKITRLELVRMAALADLNPAALWPQHAQFMAPVLEIARFGARLILAQRVGGQVRLDKSLFSPALQILGVSDNWTEDADANAALGLVRQLVGATRDLDEVMDRITLVRRFELDLVLGEPRR